MSLGSGYPSQIVWLLNIWSRGDAEVKCISRSGESVDIERNPTLTENKSSEFWSSWVIRVQ